MFDNYITENNFNSHFEYIYSPNKIECQLTNIVVYDLETHNTDRGRPYNKSFYRSSKIAAKYNRDLPPNDLDKYKQGTLVFDGDDCISYALDFFKNQRRGTKT